MIESLARAIGGVIEGDKIRTDKGLVSCNLVGRILLDPLDGRNKQMIGHISTPIPMLAAAFDRA